MPHLEEQFPPVNPLILQRPDAFAPRDREEIAEPVNEDDPTPLENRVRDEAPQPGSLADGIDRVTISANARAVVPVQPAEEAVPVPIELIPGENQVNPEVPELLVAETAARNVGDSTTGAPANTPGGLAGFNDGLADNRTATPAPGLTQASTEGLILRDRIEETNDNPVPDAQRRVAPETPPPSGPALAGQVEPRSFAPLEESSPAPEVTFGLRGTTPVPRSEGRVNIETPPALQVDPPFPNIQEARNFGQGRTLGLNLASAGNEDAAIALDNVDEVLEEQGAIPGPEVAEIRPQEILTPPAAQPGFAPEPDLNEELTPEPGGNRFTLDDTLPERPPVTPPGPAEQPELEQQQNEEPGTALPDPREFDTRREPVIEPGPEEPNAAASSLTDTREVFEEDQEFQELQPPAFPELDLDEPFVPQPEPESRAAIDALPEEEVAAIPNPQPAPLENAPAVPQPEPSPVEALNENPQALRRDNLGTDPALRSNRDLRNLLQTPDERNAPPEAGIEPEGPPITEVQNNAPPPPRVFENLEALSEQLLENLRAENAERGVTRPEEEPASPPPPRTGETLVSERGLNIDRFI